MSQTRDMGRVVPLFQGTYSASTAYELNDVVLYNSSLYWHKGASATTGVAPTNTTVWALILSVEDVSAVIGADVTAAKEAAEAAKTAAVAAKDSAESAAERAEAAEEVAEAAAYIQDYDDAVQYKVTHGIRNGYPIMILEEVE